MCEYQLGGVRISQLGGVALPLSKIKARKHFSALYEFVLVSLIYFEMLQATAIKPPNSFDASTLASMGVGIGSIKHLT